MIALPLAIFCLILVRPCTPPFLGSMLTSCSEISWFGPAIFLPLFELWIAIEVFVTGSLYIDFGLTVGIITLLNFFRVLERYEIYSKSTQD